MARSHHDPSAPDIHRMIFKGDVTTPEGVLRVGDRLWRDWMAGKFDDKRYRLAMAGLRFFATIRRRYPGLPPVDGYEKTLLVNGFEDTMPHPPSALVVEADTHTLDERKCSLDRITAKELEAMARRALSTMAKMRTSEKNGMRMSNDPQQQAELEADFEAFKERQAKVAATAAIGDDTAKVATNDESNQPLTENDSISSNGHPKD